MIVQNGCGLQITAENFPRAHEESLRSRFNWRDLPPPARSIVR